MPLEAFKARLDVALGSLVWWLVNLHTAGGLKHYDHCGPFQPRPFYDSMIILQIEHCSTPEETTGVLAVSGVCGTSSAFNYANRI